MVTSEARLSATSFTSTPSGEQLTELLQSFRNMMMAHGRVLIHESERLGLGPTDIRALFFIAEGGDEGSTPKQIAELLELSTGATTSLVDRLVGAGTLVREAHPTDRRSVILQLTPAGHAAIGAVADVYRSSLASVIPSSSYVEMTVLFGSVAKALSEGSRASVAVLA